MNAERDAQGAGAFTARITGAEGANPAGDSGRSRVRRWLVSNVKGDLLNPQRSVEVASCEKDSSL